MKNIIIAILVGIIGALGYVVFDLKSPDNDQDSKPATSQTTNQEEPKTAANSIDLSGKNLTQVPKDILDDSKVTTLDVSNNKLTGSLPGEIRLLSNLVMLNASNNQMTGVPAEIGQLSKLKTIDFSNNDLSGLPLELGNLSQLETLDLRGNPDVSKYDISQIQTKIPNASILTD